MVSSYTSTNAARTVTPFVQVNPATSLQQDDNEQQAAGAAAAATTQRMMMMNASSSSSIFSSTHLDYIHDVAFDTYGRRMASCSGDRFVKIWDYVPSPTTSTANTGVSGEMENQNHNHNNIDHPQSISSNNEDWVCSASWQAHRGAVTCCSWAHPEFGTLLATAGLDQEAKIWEERSSSTFTTTTSSTASGGAVPPPGTPNMMTMMNGMHPSSLGAGGVGSTASAAGVVVHHLWTLRASLTEAKRGVTCVAFAPRHWGLKLASASADGAVRIYEAVDIMNLSQWPLSATLQAFDNDEHHHQGHHHHEHSSSSSSSSHHHSSMMNYHLTLSWCTGRFEPPTLVVGGGGGGGSGGTQGAGGATAAASSSGASSGGSGAPHSLVVYRYSESARAWQPLLHLGGTSNPQSAPSSVSSSSSLSITSPALCVSWAPNVGRRYHYVAAAHGNALVVYKLQRGGQGGGTPSTNATSSTLNNPNESNPSSSTTTDLTLESIQIIPVSAWRCQWNVTGTVLVCSGDGGAVNMYKVRPYNNDGQWELVSSIRHDQY